MPPVGFESTISTGERQQTYALDRTNITRVHEVNNNIYILMVLGEFKATYLET
jgi:hypothetical protein